VDQWLESGEETALIELKGSTNTELNFVIGEDEEKFSVSIPQEYKKTGEHRFVISAKSKNLSTWVQDLNEWADKPKVSISQLLSRAAEKYIALTGGGGEEEEMEEDEMPGIEVPVKQEKPKKSKEEQEIDDKQFLNIGSPAATMRLVKDLKAIQLGNTKSMGFTAMPVLDKKTGLENLYHWDVRLFGFDKGSDLWKDMETYKKKTGNSDIVLEVRFSDTYPFSPPFVRVIRPRFAFRTGHVTLGGSICMELLTNSGWNSTNDIESILIQIRAEIISGGARLDPTALQGGSTDYSETEAWEAFYRAASTHGWNVNGLGKDKFPKLP
jgi:ubiquitin-conjugating enzyme E2 Q